MKAKNNKVIKEAFERLKANKDEAIEAAMYGILEDAVKIALDLHDERHDIHLVIGDTYGWALMHNGKIKDIMVVSLPENRGDAIDQLQEECAFIAESGWVGIVMAGMHPNYFSERFERLVLGETIEITKDNFFDYFKQI